MARAAAWLQLVPDRARCCGAGLLLLLLPSRLPESSSIPRQKLAARPLRRASEDPPQAMPGASQTTRQSARRPPGARRAIVRARKEPPHERSVIPVGEHSARHYFRLQRRVSAASALRGTSDAPGRRCNAADVRGGTTTCLAPALRCRRRRRRRRRSLFLPPWGRTTCPRP